MPFEDNEQTSTKNFVIAMCVFMAIMFGYEYFTDSKKSTEPVESQKTEEVEKLPEEQTSSEDTPSEIVSVGDAMNRASRIYLENDHVTGSVDLNGGIIDSIVLKDYKKTIEQSSDNVMLLTPKNTESQFYYSISYTDKTNNENISDSTVWTSDDIAGKEQSLTLKTRTQNGLIIERTITLDDGYMLKIKDKILNVSSKNIKLAAGSDLVRSNLEHHNYAVVHEGLVGYHNDKVDEVKYSDIESKKSLQDCKWLGYTDLYWLCSVINKGKNTTISYDKTDENSYRISTQRRGNLNLAPDSMVELHYAIFAGPKDIRVLKNYRDNEGLDKFDMAIDFGWFFIITKPLIQLVGFLSSLFSNMGFVILFLTLLFRFVTYPLMKKSFVSAARMKEVQPKITMLQKTYAHDKMRMNQEMMALYKREKISPMSGCLPMLLQAPIFFCLYKIFFISIEMRHAPLFGWIHDLSAPDPLYIFNLFGYVDWTPPSFLQIGLWPLIMGLTMYFQQKLSTSSSKSKNVEKTSEQKMQENMMLFMPILFTYICASFPVAVVIYWTISNVFSMIQQYYVNKSVIKRG